jgi:hypothetical protein
MLPSGVIAYGAALSALLAVVLVALIGRQRSPGVLVAVEVPPLLRSLRRLVRS